MNEHLYKEHLLILNNFIAKNNLGAQTFDSLKFYLYDMLDKVNKVEQFVLTGN